MKILKLGQIVTDGVTQTQGMLTHLCVNMEKHCSYIFQPKGLNPETLQPVEIILIEASRVVGGEEIDVDLPVEVLGSEAEDLASGFKGTIIELIYHINGCIHVDIKPVGILPKTGATIASANFDIRRLKGPKIKPLTDKKLKKSIIKKPSPVSFVKRR